jgi:hypothetical protein
MCEASYWWMAVAAALGVTTAVAMGGCVLMAVALSDVFRR